MPLQRNTWRGYEPSLYKIQVKGLQYRLSWIKTQQGTGNRGALSRLNQSVWFHEPPQYTKVCFVHMAADLGPHSTASEDDK